MNPLSVVDLESLAQRMQSHDMEAFREMVIRFTPLILRQTKALLGSISAAEDAAQEVFLKAFQALGKFRGGKISAWLQTIAHHHCLDQLRKRSEHLMPPADLEKISGNSSATGADKPALDLLAEFSDIEREVLHLRLIEEMDYKEIAAITSYSEGSLRNVVSRGIRRLRQRVMTNGL